MKSATQEMMSKQTLSQKIIPISSTLEYLVREQQGQLTVKYYQERVVHHQHLFHLQWRVHFHLQLQDIFLFYL